MPKDTFSRLRDEKQERIIRAAIHEFTEHGFERAKIGDIAKNSEVAAGSLYQYFDDKKDLYVYCAEWSIKKQYEKLFSRINIRDMDVFEYLETYFSVIESATEDRELILFLRQLDNGPPLQSDEIKASIDTGEGNYWEELIQNSKRKGTVRNDFDDDLLLDCYIAISSQFAKRFIKKWDFISVLSEEQRLALQDEIHQLIDFLKNGMGC